MFGLDASYFFDIKKPSTREIAYRDGAHSLLTEDSGLIFSTAWSPEHLRCASPTTKINQHKLS